MQCLANPALLLGLLLPLLHRLDPVSRGSSSEIVVHKLVYVDYDGKCGGWKHPRQNRTKFVCNAYVALH